MGERIEEPELRAILAASRIPSRPRFLTTTALTMAS